MRNTILTLAIAFMSIHTLAFSDVSEIKEELEVLNQEVMQKETEKEAVSSLLKMGFNYLESKINQRRSVLTRKLVAFKDNLQEIEQELANLPKNEVNEEDESSTSYAESADDTYLERRRIRTEAAIAKIEVKLQLLDDLYAQFLQLKESLNR